MSTSPNARDPRIASAPPVIRSAVVEEERRLAGRVAVRAPVQLLGMGGEQGVPCTVSDISEWGVFVHVPRSAGLCVGQRYEVTVPAKDAPPELAGLRAEGAYATVVRTGRVGTESHGSMIGAGMRFDQPLIV